MGLEYRDADWVWEALIKQFELETGLTVAALDDKLEHILGKGHGDKEFRQNLLLVEFKGIEFEIDEA